MSTPLSAHPQVDLSRVHRDGMGRRVIDLTCSRCERDFTWPVSYLREQFRRRRGFLGICADCRLQHKITGQREDARRAAEDQQRAAYLRVRVSRDLIGHVLRHWADSPSGSLEQQTLDDLIARLEQWGGLLRES